MFLRDVPLADALANRVSVRHYTAETVHKDTVRDLLEAALRAPTAMHQEPWRFVIVQDRARLKRLSDAAKPLFLDELHRAHLDRSGSAPAFFSDPAFDIFHGAGTLIVICGARVGPFIEADCWLAAENLMLAACAMGLGTCVIGSAVAALNTGALRDELGIPADVRAIAPIVVGHAAEAALPTPRKPAHILSWK